MTESWKSVLEYDNYHISTTGIVKNKKTGKHLSLKSHNSGKLSVTLCKMGKSKTFRVSDLIMKVFIGPKPEGNIIRHINENGHNNNLDNLEYSTHSENTKHAHDMGLIKKGKRYTIHLSQKTLDGVLVKNHNSISVAAKEMGVTEGHLGNMSRGRGKTCKGFIWERLFE
jgi:hypothetical protein